jgi:hypothetical protein
MTGLDERGTHRQAQAAGAGEPDPVIRAAFR